MMNSEPFFDDMSSHIALWCGAGMCDGDLVRCAEYAISNDVRAVSVVPDDVARMWVWLERSAARVFARFYIPHGGDMSSIASDLSGRIRTAFRHGAAGAQVFLRASDLSAFAHEMSNVCADLFFNRELEIGIDVADVDASMWGALYDMLRQIGASGVIFVLTHDKGERCDFVGRVYAAMDAIGADSKCAVRFVTGNRVMRMEQALRLVRAMRPELAGGARVFVNMCGDLQ